MTVTHVGCSDRNDQHLSRRQPKWPFPCKMLRNDGNKPLQTPQNRTMDDNRTCEGLFVRRAVLKVESFRELEVELDGGALE